MHTQETKDRFLELRSRGISLSRISEAIRVSRPTLVDWNRQFQPQLRTLRAAELESLQERLLVEHDDDLALLGRVQKKILFALDDRDIGALDTRQLLGAYLRVRREVARIQLATDILNQPAPLPPPSTPPPPAPADPTPPAP
jgi:hypothetical protein